MGECAYAYSPNGYSFWTKYAFGGLMVVGLRSIGGWAKWMSEPVTLSGLHGRQEYLFRLLFKPPPRATSRVGGAFG